VDKTFYGLISTQETQAEGVATAVTIIEEPTSAEGLVTFIEILAEEGGRLTLSPDNTTIAYDKRGDDKFSDVWTMLIDGENQQCLTCDHPLLPTRNVGQPRSRFL
jgi:hypothetical protein